MPNADATQGLVSPQAFMSQTAAEQPSALGPGCKDVVDRKLKCSSKTVQAATPRAVCDQQAESAAALRLAASTSDKLSLGQANNSQGLPALATDTTSSSDDQADAQLPDGAAEQSTAGHAEATQHSFKGTDPLTLDCYWLDAQLSHHAADVIMSSHSEVVQDRTQSPACT